MSAVVMSTVVMSTAAMSGGISGGFTPVPKLRLTQRGRGVLTFLAATPLVIAAFLFALNGGGATASLEGSSVPFEYVTVEAGQSLWQVAEQVAPQSDPREVIAQFVQLNQLGGSDVYAGQELAIPMGLR